MTDLAAPILLKLILRHHAILVCVSLLLEFPPIKVGVRGRLESEWGFLQLSMISARGTPHWQLT